MKHLCTLPVLTLLLTACSGSAVDAEGDDGPDGLSLLGSYTHTADSVSVTEILSGLELPRDLAFNPEVDDELWITDDDAGEMVIISGTNTDAQSDDGYKSSASGHFFARPAALAFGASGTLATAHDEDEPTQSTTPDDFMGPTLWTSNLDYFDAGHGGHLDMLHNSPNSTGIAWQEENIYWVLDGYHGSLTRYDFHSDHGEGGSDHSDGEIARFVEGELDYVGDVSSHLVYDADTALLYVTDTASGRILVLDTTSGEEGSGIGPNYDGADQYAVEDADLWALIEGGDLVSPSGLELYEDTLYVSDHATGIIYGYSLDGELLDWLDTGLGEESLMGMAFHPDGSLYVTDAAGGRILRIAAQ